MCTLSFFIFFFLIVTVAKTKKAYGHAVVFFYSLYICCCQLQNVCAALLLKQQDVLYGWYGRKRGKHDKCFFLNTSFYLPHDTTDLDILKYCFKKYQIDVKQ